MKTTVKIALFVLLVFPAGMTSGKEQVKAAELKIGYIRLEEIFQSYYRTEQVLGQLKTELQAKEEEIRKLGEEIKQMEGEMYLLSPEGKKKKEAVVKARKLQFRRIKQESEVLISDKILAAKEKLYQEIVRVVKEKGRARGYAFVFTEKVMNYPLIIYGAPGCDLTDEVLGELNRGQDKAITKSE